MQMSYVCKKQKLPVSVCKKTKKGDKSIKFHPHQGNLLWLDFWRYFLSVSPSFFWSLISMRLTSGEIHSLVPKVFVEKWLLWNKSFWALDKTNIYCNKHHKNNLPLILRNVSLGQGLLQTVLEFMMSPELPNCQHSGGKQPLSCWKFWMFTSHDGCNC